MGRARRTREEGTDGADREDDRVKRGAAGDNDNEIERNLSEDGDKSNDVRAALVDNFDEG